LISHYAAKEKESYHDKLNDIDTFDSVKGLEDDKCNNKDSCESVANVVENGIVLTVYYFEILEQEVIVFL